MLTKSIASRGHRTLFVGEAQPMTTKLTPQEPVLFEAGSHVPFSAIYTARPAHRVTICSAVAPSAAYVESSSIDPGSSSPSQRLRRGLPDDA
jgi:hypothetical protein